MHSDFTPCLDSLMQRILDNITNNRSQLIDILECQYGLLDQLISRDVLNRRQAGQLELMNSNPWKQNEELIQLLLDEEIIPELLYKLDHLVSALRVTHQSHIANLLIKDEKGKCFGYLTFLEVGKRE